MRYKQAEYNDFVMWLGLSKEERKDGGHPHNVAAYARKKGLPAITLYKWRDEYSKGKYTPILKDTPEVMAVRNDVMREKIDRFDHKIFLKSKQEFVCRKLIEKIEANKANAKDFELYYKLIGNLDAPKEKEKEKLDVNVNIVNLIALAKQQLNDSGDRNIREIEVSNVSTLFPGKPLLDTGQGDNVNTPVQTMGLPEESAGDDTE